MSHFSGLVVLTVYTRQYITDTTETTYLGEIFSIRLNCFPNTTIQKLVFNGNATQSEAFYIGAATTCCTNKHKNMTTADGIYFTRISYLVFM